MACRDLRATESVCFNSLHNENRIILSAYDDDDDDDDDDGGGGGGGGVVAAAAMMMMMMMMVAALLLLLLLLLLMMMMMQVMMMILMMITVFVLADDIAIEQEQVWVQTLESTQRSESFGLWTHRVHRAQTQACSAHQLPPEKDSRCRRV